jgi:hypothetical protein
LVAYYVAHAAVNREFLFSRIDDAGRDYAGVILLYNLAMDSIARAETPAHEKPSIRTWRAGQVSFQEQYEHYMALEFWISVELSERLVADHLAPHANHFEYGMYFASYALVKHLLSRSWGPNGPR